VTALVAVAVAAVVDVVDVTVFVDVRPSASVPAVVVTAVDVEPAAVVAHVVVVVVLSDSDYEDMYDYGSIDTPD